MFENDYKKEMNEIKPDGFIKHKVRKKLEEAEEGSKNKSKGIYFGRAVAAALCVCLIFTAGAILGRRTAPVVSTAKDKEPMKTAPDYGKIYSALEEFKPSFLDGVKDYITYGADADIEYAIEESATIADDGSANTGARPSANKGTSSSATDINTDKGSDGYSETTTQVEGVDEADIIKTDGEYIYILNRMEEKKKITIVRAGQKPVQLSSIVIEENAEPSDLYLSDNRLAVLCGDYEKNEVVALIYDISNPNAPKKLQSCTQSGLLNTSRLIGTKLYIVSNLTVNVNRMTESDTLSYMPYIY